MPKSTYRAEAEDGRLVAEDLLTHAVAFAGAADAYRRTATQASDWRPTYFMMARSLELALKAYLRHVGATPRQLLNIGHDLKDAISQSAQQGLTVPLTEEEIKCFGVLGFWYRENYLGYPLRRPHAFPRPRIARTIVDKVLGAVYVATIGASAYEDDKCDPQYYGLSIDESAGYGE